MTPVGVERVDRLSSSLVSVGRQTCPGDPRHRVAPTSTNPRAESGHLRTWTVYDGPKEESRWDS